MASAVPSDMGQSKSIQLQVFTVCQSKLPSGIMLTRTLRSAKSKYGLFYEGRKQFYHLMFWLAFGVCFGNLNISR